MKRLTCLVAVSIFMTGTITFSMEEDQETGPISRPLSTATIPANQITVDDAVETAREINTQATTKLFSGVRRNSPKEVEEAINAGANLNAQDDNGQTPLYWAVITANILLIRLLTTSKNINTKNNQGKTPLHSAAINGLEKVAKELLSSGAQCNICDKKGQTPLHMAASNDAQKVAEELLSSGAQTNICDKKGQTPLHMAASNGAQKVAEKLLASGALTDICDKKGQTPLHAAVACDHNELVKILSEYDRKCRKASLKKIQSQDTLSTTSNEHTYQLKKEEVHKRLFNDAVSGSTDEIREAVKLKIDLDFENEDGNTLLHIAAQNGHFNIVELLITEAKVAISPRNRAGETPLHLAINNNHLAIMSFLISNKANLISYEKGQQPPLELALDKKNEDAVVILLDNMVREAELSNPPADTQNPRRSIMGTLSAWLGSVPYFI